jgi:hypothetical protein
LTRTGKETFDSKARKTILTERIIIKDKEKKEFIMDKGNLNDPEETTNKDSSETLKSQNLDKDHDQVSKLTDI